MALTLQRVNHQINSITTSSFQNISLDDMKQQLFELEKQAILLKEALTKNPPHNPRRPNKQYKNIKSELTLLEKQIKKTNKDLKKFHVIKNTALHMGKAHGKIALHGANIYW